MSHPKPTLKQETFISGYLETSNATEAYRRAYACDGMTEKTINECASRLLKNHKVAARVNQLREKIVEKSVLTRAWIIDQLMDNVVQGKANKDLTAANKALEMLGKTEEMQMFVERARVESDNRHTHQAGHVSPFAEFLEQTISPDAEDASEASLPN